MSSHEEEEETGPSVDSTDPEERIAARRIRITKRIEAAKREAMGEDPNAKKKEDKEEQSKSRKQIEESRQRLTKLKADGTELVTNVKVAGDSREAQRRTEEEENHRQRTEKLEAEAKAGAERFEEITKKWESANNKDVPQDLHDLLMQQKALCDAMIDEKNKLITDFQMELKSKDDQYVKDLKKQAEDIDLMIERMEEQVKNLTRSYREELNQIEKAFEAERNELLDNNGVKWGQTMQGRRDKEVDFMKSREKRVDDYEQQIQHLRTQDAEEYNMVKIKLETDVQILEQQLQQMRATYQLNQEKLEYNFQVLKKRDEENTITKSQQKRKITRLQDVLNNLKVKLAKQEKQYREDNQALADDYKRITEQFKELQKKSKHFQATDTRKFYDIWVMNEEQAKQLVNDVLEQDRIIHEHQLGLPWNVPDVTFLENVGPLTSTGKKTVSAQQVLEEVMSSTKGSVGNGEDESELGEEEAEAGEDGLPKLSMKTIKQVLELLCDESGFLVESKLNKLLQPLEKDERSLMKLDAIFGALGIETEEDIHKLAGYFIKYKLIPAKGTEKHEDGEPSILEATIAGEGSVSGVGDGTIGTVTEEGEQKETQEGEGEFEDQDVDAEVAQVTGEDEEVASVQSSVKSVADSLIHPNDVLKALREFVDDHHSQSKDKGKFQTFKIISGEERDDSQDEEYWRKYGSVLTTQNEKVWTALVTGLDKYSDVLNQRTKLISETDALRQQNAELRMLLHQYINSKVNNELEIPPTRVLNLEFQQ